MVLKLPNTAKGHVTSQNPPRPWKWPQKVFWMIHSRALTPLLMATVQNGGATLTVGRGGVKGSWERLKGPQISGQWQRRATQGWMRRVFANPSPQRNSPTFSFLLSPPTDCQQYLLIFCCLATWSAYLFPHSHFLPGQRKRHFLVVGKSCWVNHSGWVRSTVTKLREKKGLPDEIWISYKECIFSIQVYPVQYLGHNPLTLSVVYLKFTWNGHPVY